MLVGVRAIQGLAMGAIMVCARAAVRDVYVGVEGARALARGMTGLGAIALLAPLTGALVVQSVGWRWVFVGMALYAVVLLGLCAGRFAETRVAQAPGALSGGSTLEVFANPSFRAWGRWPSLRTAAYSVSCCCRPRSTSATWACRRPSTHGFPRWHPSSTS